MMLRLKQDHDVEFIIIAAPSESAQLIPVKAALNDIGLFLEAPITPMDLAALMKRCTLVITKDSGPRHLANAVGIPVVFFRSLAHRRAEAAIYCDTEIDVCPAGELLAPPEQEKVLNGIPVSTLIDAIRPLLVG
jgi:ADP-heptose:LPS heptosyltransferase